MFVNYKSSGYALFISIALFYCTGGTYGCLGLIKGGCKTPSRGQFNRGEQEGSVVREPGHTEASLRKSYVVVEVGVPGHKQDSTSSR